jgi:DNA-binding beta-propeller fold protein YncE
VQRTVKVGGEGGFDYVFADVAERRLYIPRTGPAARISIFNLDTLEPAGEIPHVDAHGITIDPKSHHGFASSQPILMWDTKTLKTIKTIAVENHPDRLLFDPFTERVFVFSKEGEVKGGGPSGEKVSVINAVDGDLVGTVELGGTQEEGVSDGKGHVYINVEDQRNIAVVDAKTLKVTAHYDVTGKGGHCGGLALDLKNRLLFATCRVPSALVILNADDGKIIQTFAIETTADGAAFNPKTMEAFSSNGNCGTSSAACGPVGTLTVVRESSPTSFVLEQVLQTMPRAKTQAFDSKTGRIFLITAEYGPRPEGRGRAPMLPDSFSILVVGR